MVSGSASTPPRREDDRCCRTRRAVFERDREGTGLDRERVHRDRRAGAGQNPRARPVAFSGRCPARALLARVAGPPRGRHRGSAQGGAAARADRGSARRRGDAGVAAGHRSRHRPARRAPSAAAAEARGLARTTPRRGPGSWPCGASRVGVACGCGRAAPRTGRRKRILDRRGADVEDGPARAPPRQGAPGRGRSPQPHRSTAAWHGSATVPAQPAAHALVRIQRTPRPSAGGVPPLGVPSMAEPLSAAKTACALCGGEGFAFQQREDKGVAVACSCTAQCPACGGQGRLYARDERGYEMVRGCPCGADPRRLSLLTGLRLPPKFLERTLAGYRAYSPAQQRALLRARRFVDEFVPGAAGQRALLFCGPPGTGKTHLLSAMLRNLAARKAVRGRYEEFFLLLSDIRDGFSRGLSSREWLEPLRQVDVLAIDEIGKGGKNRDFEQGVLDEVLSVRYNAGRPTLLATNYPRPGTVGWEFRADGQSAENLEQRVGPRIYSRLHEMCDLIDVVGDDQREVQHDARQARDSAADGPARGAGPARS